MKQMDKLQAWKKGNQSNKNQDWKAGQEKYGKIGKVSTLNQEERGNKYLGETTGSTEIESIGKKPKTFLFPPFSLLAEALKENWLNLRNLFQQTRSRKKG